jgi:hypothetical protein
MMVAQSGNFPLAVEVTNVATMLGEADADTDLREKRTPVGP